MRFCDNIQGFSRNISEVLSRIAMEEGVVILDKIVTRSGELILLLAE